MLKYNNIAEKGFVLNNSLVLIMAVASGITVANLYYAQPLLADIARSFHVSQGNIGAAAMLTQIGYALGMFFFLPLGDIKERRSLIILMLCLTAGALIIMAIAFNVMMLFLASFAIGFTSVVPQLIVPFAAQLAKSEERGKIIGNVMSGLLIGILVSRTFSGIIGSAFGWRTVYGTAAVMMLMLAVILKSLLPISPATSNIKYGELIGSLWHLIKGEKVLREASFVGAMMFATFSTFWTSLIFFLESPAYNLGTETAGLFGLVGVTGAAAATFVGRISDKKSPRFTVAVAICISILSYICFLSLGFKMWGLIIGVILLDIGIQSAQISNQAIIYALNPEARNRLNTVYMVSYFIGGASGSILGSYAWQHFGWSGVCIVGLLFQALAITVGFEKGKFIQAFTNIFEV